MSYLWYALFVCSHHTIISLVTSKAQASPEFCTTTASCSFYSQHHTTQLVPRLSFPYKTLSSSSSCCCCSLLGRPNHMEYAPLLGRPENMEYAPFLRKPDHVEYAPLEGHITWSMPHTSSLLEVTSGATGWSISAFLLLLGICLQNW